jgi:hypothetical protein
MEPGEAKGFDPARSLRAGVEVLRAAGVPFALAGRLAVWTYVPERSQRYTRDVDFAVPYGYSEQAAAVAERMGFNVTKLPLGYGLRKEGMLIDLVDRHPDLDDLFLAAVNAAREELESSEGGGDSVPVVPLGFLVAMKLATGREKDDEDVSVLLKELDEAEYGEVRTLVRRHLGFGMASRLDMIARRIGHPGPGMEIDS